MHAMKPYMPAHTPRLWFAWVAFTALLFVLLLGCGGSERLPDGQDHTVPVDSVDDGMQHMDGH